MPAPEPVEVVVIWTPGLAAVKAGTQRLNSGYSRLEPVSTRVVAACAVPVAATVAARARAATPERKAVERLSMLESFTFAFLIF